MISAGLLGQLFQRDLAVGGFEDLVALRAQPHPQQLADRRLVVDDEDLYRGGAADAAVSSSSLSARRHRQADGEYRRLCDPRGFRRRSCRAWPRQIRAISRGRDLCRDAPDPPSARDKTCRRRFPGRRRNPAALIRNLEGRSHRLIAPPPARYRDAGGVIFGGVVEHVEQHLFKQDGIERQHRQIGGELKRDLVMAKDLLARRSALPTIWRVLRRGIRYDGAGFQLCHIEQIGDEAIEPLGFVDHGGQQIALLCVGQPQPTSRIVEAAPSTEANGA